MKTTRILIGLLLALVLTTSCDRDEGPYFDFVQAFTSARADHLIGFKGVLGSDAAVPFVIRPTQFDQNAGVVRFPAGRPGGLEFLLFRQQDVRVTLEGRLQDAKHADLSFVVNEKPLETAELTSGFATLEVTIPASQTRVGRNDFIFGCEQASEWRTASFESVQAEPSLEVTESQARLDLPFGSIVDYPVVGKEPGSMRLSIEAWTEPGAPQLASGSWELKLTLTSDHGKEVGQWSLGEVGRHTLELPEFSGYHILSLSLQGHQPLPGQLGLVLTGRAPEKDLPDTEEGLNPPLATKPNVILFVIDTLRADYLQPYGSSFPNSPHLQEFCKDAILYQNCMAPAPWTKPSVATLITALSPAEHGVLGFADKLAEEHVTLAEVLAESGYHNYAVVNNGLLNPMFGYDQGYAEYRMVDAETTATRQFTFALEQYKENLRDPFLFYLHVLDPHMAYRPTLPVRKQFFREFGLEVGPAGWGASGLDNDQILKFVKQSRRAPAAVVNWKTDVIKALYNGEIAESDRGFGRMVEWLKQEGLYKDSLIVVTSDHGEEMMDRGAVGHLTTLHQEMIHVPLMIKMPGNVGGGSVVPEPCQLSNVTPTILATTVGGEPIQPGATTLKQKTAQSPSEPIFFGADVGQDAVLVRQGERNYRVHSEGVRLGGWVMARYFSSTRKSGPLSLYDLESDPKELQDLLWEHPALSLYLESLLRRQRTATGTVKIPREEEAELRQILESLQYLE
jgi:arylsulfatase A-like enzyme